MYFITDWTKRIDFDRLREKRLESLRQRMKERKIMALLSFKNESIRYMTGLRPLWFPIAMIRSAAIFVSDQDPMCYVIGGDWAHRKATMYWLKAENIRPLAALEDKTLIEKNLPDLKRGFDELGVDGGRIGVDLFTFDLFRGLEKMLPKAEWVDGDECVRAARLIKNEEEIKLMRAASACVDIAMQAAIDAVAVGRRECEILGEANRVMYNLGMEIPQCNSIVASGENLSPLCRFASDRIIRSGDLVFIDIGGCFNGMFAEATRTVICGEPNPDQKKIYRTIHESMGAILQAMRPGRTNTDVYDALAGVFRKNGFDKYSLFTVMGHSIGVGGWEPPTMGQPEVSGAVFTLEPGMIFSIEPTLNVPGIPGGGGVRLEEEVLITDTGNEVLTRAPYDKKLLD